MTVFWETRMVNTNRGTFEVFVKGEGAPLCVTHHYSEFNHSGDLFADQFTSTNKVLLVNLREAGNSEKAYYPYQLSMIETVIDLEEIREALGYETWHFAGHSTGGMIGLVYGVRYPSSLNSLIIVGAAAREYASSSPYCIYHSEHPQFQKMQDLIEQLKQPQLTEEERKELSEERTKLSLYDPDKYEEYFPSNIHKKMSAIRMNFFAREVVIYDITKQLPRITTKTLIICGKHDVQCPLPFSQEMQELIPGSSLKVFQESNHYPFLEEKELFQQVIEEFYDFIGIIPKEHLLDE